MSKPFYITTTLPYVNAEPHIGFATEIIRADIIARWRRLLGDEVFFNTGTDEHGQKIYQKALALNRDPYDYVTELSKKFHDLLIPLGISQDVNFIRTTDQEHLESAQIFWRQCDQNGFIYKKNYQVKYCVGCELEKTDSELVDGFCPFHPTTPLELRTEENYFFRFSAFQTKLLALYELQPDFVLPPERLNEVRNFVASGLQDFSISRLASKMPWGIPVPGDSTQVMYVWFDALVNYLSAIGWPDDKDNFDKWWLKSGGPVQYCGKDNLRQQSAMWQAMLMSLGLPNSQQIIVEGFITSHGQKMSKSLGNTINPLEIVEKYDTDTLRYLVAREFSTFNDSDFNWGRLKEVYNADLANGLGNLTSRILRLSELNLSSCPTLTDDPWPQAFVDFLANYDIGRATDFIWQKIKALDIEIQKKEPFKLIKIDRESANKIITDLVTELYLISRLLKPILPETAEKIDQAIKQNKMPKPLFVRKD